jgi:hypothetical protein
MLRALLVEVDRAPGPPRQRLVPNLDVGPRVHLVPIAVAGRVSSSDIAVLYEASRVAMLRIASWCRSFSTLAGSPAIQSSADSGVAEGEDECSGQDDHGGVTGEQQATGPGFQQVGPA